MMTSWNFLMRALFSSLRPDLTRRFRVGAWQGAHSEASRPIFASQLRRTKIPHKGVITSWPSRKLQQARTAGV